MIKPDITFALVQTFHRHGKNHFSSFLPLIADCALQLDEEYILIEAIKNKCKDIYGLEIPSSVLKKILLIGKSHDIFIFDNGLIKKGRKLSEINIREPQNKYMKEHDSLISYFIEYMKNKKEIKITKDSAEKAMYTFMDENVYNLIKIGIRKASEKVTISGNEIKVSFGRFIRDAIENNNSKIIEYISDIAKGVMIYNAIYLPNLEKLEKKFSETTLILDTPLILSLLGYAGEERKIPILELVEMAHSNGAGIGVFDFTLSEVGSILDACAERLRNSHKIIYGKTIEYFIEQKFTYEEVIIFKGNLEKNLRKLQITVLEKPEYNPAYCLDEIELERCIDKNLRYKFESSKRKDIDAISATYRLRKGKPKLYLENATAIFITSNYGLVKAAQSLSNIDHNMVDLVMTEFYITNILWLKKPTKFPNLPKKRAIADIVSALQPSDILWNDFITIVEDMHSRAEITYEDVLILRTSSQTADLLIDSTNEGIDILAPASVKEILDTINHNKEAEFKKKQNDKLMKKAMKIGKNISNIISAMLVCIVLIFSFKDIIYPCINHNKIKIIYIFSYSIFLLLSILNLAIGISINIIKKSITNILSRLIFKFFCLLIN